MNWAVGQLLIRTREAGAGGDAAVGKIAEGAGEVGKAEDVKRALGATK